MSKILDDDPSREKPMSGAGHKPARSKGSRSSEVPSLRTRIAEMLSPKHARARAEHQKNVKAHRDVLASADVSLQNALHTMLSEGSQKAQKHCELARMQLREIPGGDDDARVRRLCGECVRKSIADMDDDVLQRLADDFAALAKSDQALCTPQKPANPVIAQLDLSFKAALLSKKLEAMKAQGVANWGGNQQKMSSWPRKELREIRDIAAELMRSSACDSKSGKLPGSDLKISDVEAAKQDATSAMKLLARTWAVSVMNDTEPTDIAILPTGEWNSLLDAQELLKEFSLGAHATVSATIGKAIESRRLLEAKIDHLNKAAQALFQEALRAALGESDADEMADKLLDFVVKAQLVQRGYALRDETFVGQALLNLVQKAVRGQMAIGRGSLKALQAFLNHGEGKAMRDRMANSRIDRVSDGRRYLDVLSMVLDSELAPANAPSAQKTTHAVTALAPETNTALLRYLHVEERDDAPGPLVDRAAEIASARAALKEDLEVEDIDHAWEVYGHIALVASTSLNVEELRALKSLSGSLTHSIGNLHVSGVEQEQERFELQLQAMTLSEAVGHALTSAMERQTPARNATSSSPPTLLG